MERCERVDVRVIDIVKVTMVRYLIFPVGFLFITFLLLCVWGRGSGGRVEYFVNVLFFVVVVIVV